MTAVVATGVRHAYDARTVLDGVDVTLEPGRVTVIMGPNGVGKSTLLRVLAGLVRPTAGAVTIDGRALGTWRRRDLARRVAVVLGLPDTAFAWTSAQLVLMGRAPHLTLGRLEGAADRQAARDALARVDAADLADRAFATLSAGEQQRVLIARALCQDTPVLLLDEPTSHLDPAHALRVGQLMRELAAEGRTICAVLHDLNLAGAVADHVLMLAGGAVAASGSAATVLTPTIIRDVYGVEARRVERAGGPPAVVLDASIAQE